MVGSAPLETKFTERASPLLPLSWISNTTPSGTGGGIPNGTTTVARLRLTPRHEIGNVSPSTVAVPVGFSPDGPLWASNVKVALIGWKVPTSWVAVPLTESPVVCAVTTGAMIRSMLAPTARNFASIFS